MTDLLAVGGHDGRVSARLVELHHDEHLISTDAARLDIPLVHRSLSTASYWAVGRSLETQRRAIDHSALVIGAYDAAGEQVGFARMGTDLARFAWLADVFVIDAARGVGLGRAMVRTTVEHPNVASIALQLLATRDAHGLYGDVGYEALAEPDRWMLRHVAS